MNNRSFSSRLSWRIIGVVSIIFFASFIVIWLVSQYVITNETNARINTAVTRDGEAVASAAMRPVLNQVSNLGSEPLGGNGMASAVTDQIVNDAVEVMGNIMQRDDTYVGATPLGNNFRGTEFHEMNDNSSTWQQRRTASSYGYWNLAQM